MPCSVRNPKSLSTDWFIEAAYLHGKNEGQLGHFCGCLLDGEFKTFIARNIELITPVRMAYDLVESIIVPIDDHPLPCFGELDDGAEAEPVQDVVDGNARGLMVNDGYGFVANVATVEVSLMLIYFKQ